MRNPPSLVLLAVCTLLGVVRPGELIQLEAQITGRFGKLIQAQAEAFVESTKILHAELTLAGAD